MRYLPLTDADRKAMLGKIGVTNTDALFATVPKNKLLGGLLDLPKGKSELAVERSMGRLAAQNTPARSRSNASCRRSPPAMSPPAARRSSAAPAPIAIMSPRRSTT